MVICLERSAHDLHIVQLVPLPLHLLLLHKIQNALPFCCWLIHIVLEKRPLNGVCLTFILCYGVRCSL